MAVVLIHHRDDAEQLADLRLEVQVAENALKAAKKEAADSGGAARAGDDAAAAVIEAEQRLADAKARFSAFVDEAAERADEWVIDHIGHEEFRQLLRDHPPRKIKVTGEDGKESEEIHPDDADWDVNTETFPKALVLFVDPEDEEVRTVVKPFDSLPALRKRVKRLSAGQFDSIWITAHALNGGMVGDPKASPYYVAGPRSVET